MPPTNNKKKTMPKNKKVAKTVPATTVAATPAPATPAPATTAPATPAPATSAPVTPDGFAPSETTSAPVTAGVSDTPYLEEFTATLTELDLLMTTVRTLKTRLQKLEKQCHRDHKANIKKINGKRARKPRDPDAPKSGFAKEGPVSPEMAKFLGLKKDGLVSRTDVTKKIHEYCKAKNLQDPADKRHIKPDATLMKLLRISKTDDLTFFNLQKFMKVHFPNKEGVYPTL